MQSTPRAYAKALYEATEDVSKQEAGVIVDRFLTELKAANALSQSAAIITEFERLSDEVEGVIRATITSAQPLSKKVLAEAADFVLKRTKGNSVVWNEVIDDTILGGAVISYGDFIIDMSLASRISGLASSIKE